MPFLRHARGNLRYEKAVAEAPVRKLEGEVEMHLNGRQELRAVGGGGVQNRSKQPRANVCRYVLQQFASAWTRRGKKRQRQ